MALPRRPLLGLLEEVEGRWRWPSWRGGSWCGRPPPGGAPHRSSLLPGRPGGGGEEIFRAGEDFLKALRSALALGRYTPAQVGDEHGVIASIAIKNPETGEWVEKQDGSGATDMEPFKGGISGALKRAAVAWGIGRELYRYPRVIIEGEHRYIPRPVLERLAKLPEAVAQGKPLPEVVRLNANGETVKR